MVVVAVVVVVVVMSKLIFENFFCYNIPKKTPATPELNLASRGLAVAPRPSHTAVLLCAWCITGAVLNSASGGRRYCAKNMSIPGI